MGFVHSDIKKFLAGVSLNSADNVAIVHGLGSTPRWVQITWGVATNLCTVNNVGSLHFHVAIKVAATGLAGANDTIYWIVGY